MFRGRPRQGPGLQRRLNDRTDSFARTLNSEFAALGVPLAVHNTGSFFRFAQHGNLSFTYQPIEIDLFNAGMLARGVYITEGGTSFLSTAHDDRDVSLVIDAAVAAVMTQGRDILDIRQTDFPLPTLGPVLAVTRDALVNGCGISLSLFLA